MKGVDFKLPWPIPPSPPLSLETTVNIFCMKGVDCGEVASYGYFMECVATEWCDA